MKFTGKVTGINQSWETGASTVTITVNEPAALNTLEKLRDRDKLLIAEVDEYRNRRGRDANACLWWCISRISKALAADSWKVYLQMLKRYGVFETVTCTVDALENLQTKWRESDIVGSRVINNRLYVDVNLYFGSSTYNTKEFSDLLNGVISEMQEMGLETPLPEEIRDALERWEHGKKHNPGR